jgi:hypothetical protein
MFGLRGNPQARNFFGIIGYLQDEPACGCTGRGDR